MATNDSGWQSALRALGRVIPGAKNFFLESIVEAIVEEGRGCTWAEIPCFAKGEDSEIWSFVASHTAVRPEEECFLVTDASFKGAGPIHTTVVQLDSLVRTFIETYGDEVFSGDVIVVLLSSVVLVHHDGLVARIEGAK